MRKWMDKGGAKVEGGTPAPRGVTYLTNWNLYLYPIWRYERWYKITKMGCFGVVRCHSRSLEIVPLTDCIQVYPRRATSAWVKTNKAFWLIFNQIFVSNPNPKNQIRDPGNPVPTTGYPVPKPGNKSTHYLYLHAKFHWNRRNFLWTDRWTGRRTFETHFIRSTRRRKRFILSY